VLYGTKLDHDSTRRSQQGHVITETCSRDRGR
jgi:hypothetical protein